jgi:DNA-binding beta-propeller fold protein YncE
MRSHIQQLTIALFATTAFAAAAQAQSGPCLNDLPSPYKQVTGWEHMPRAWAPTNNVFVDAKDNVWVMDRCTDKGCLGSEENPIWELSSDGKVVKSFGGGMFAFPHTVKPGPDGSIWAIDGDAKDGKGNQVFKFSPDGKVLMTLGKKGQGGTGDDVFDRPTGIAFAPNGDIFISEGHAPTFGNSRITKFDKNGKFIKSFGHLGSGDGELKGPHVLAFDSQGRLFVADRSNSRVAIFDQDGKFIAAWKQFGRPSGIFIDKNDVLYVSDSESKTRRARTPTIRAASAASGSAAPRPARWISTFPRRFPRTPRTRRRKAWRPTATATSTPRQSRRWKSTSTSRSRSPK